MRLDTYKFCNTHNYRQFDNISGIYALIYKGEVVYIGQSINVRNRLTTHHSYEYHIKKAIADYNKFQKPSHLNTKARYEFIRDHMYEIEFLVLPVDREKLDEVEEEYIDKYKPRFNWAGVKIAYPHSKKQSA